VDAFNAAAVHEFRMLDETAAIRSFEHTREALLDLLRLFQSLPEAARENPEILKRLEMETAGHYSEHAL
jgi:hypothetical protein